MNERHFACPVCKTYISAGYRWAYWSLEHDETVQLDCTIDVDAVIKHPSYWNPPQEDSSEWLYRDVLPLVRSFLSEHCAHDITYLDCDALFTREDFESWKEIEPAPHRPLT